MTVAVVRAAKYTEDIISGAVRECFEVLGGIEAFVRPGQRVALKANLVMKKHPDEAVTTHPLVVAAVAAEVLRAGGRPVICDSPGGPHYTLKGLENIYRTCGMTEAAKHSGAELNFDLSEQVLSHPEGAVIRSLPVISPVAGADVIINLPKLKTHAMTTYSGAVKNMYGVIPGMKKAEFHFKMPGYRDFSNLLVDINTLLKPSLHLMDAVVGMEGDGPTAGRPKAVGLLLASANPFDLDAVCLRLIGFHEADVPTQVAGRRRGRFTSDSFPEILGEFSGRFPDLVSFERPRSRSINFVDNYLPSWLAAKFSRFLRPRPLFDSGTCLGCGECVRLCPAGALRLMSRSAASADKVGMAGSKLPMLDETACIRCFCCQELCPQKAVGIGKSWLAKRLFGRD